MYVEGHRGEDDSLTLPHIVTISTELIHPSEKTDHSKAKLFHLHS